MATQSVYEFNKFGFCKYKEMCRKKHVGELCENLNCDIKTCNLSLDTQKNADISETIEDANLVSGVVFSMFIKMMKLKNSN